jgi:4-hydroxyphenylpyruvate dioxygenase
MEYLMNTQPAVAVQPSAKSFPKLNGYDYIELYVGNAHQAAHFYRTAWGFKPVAYQGLETGVRDRVSIVVEQGQIRLVLTAAQGPDGPIADHVKLHGDGVKDIAFLVDDVEEVFNQVVEAGARPITAPVLLHRDHAIRRATVAAYGDTVHSFIERGDYTGPFLPGYKPARQYTQTTPIGLKNIDHIAVSVTAGALEEFIEFYNRVFGFHQSHQEDVATEYSAMNSKVVQNKTGTIKFPIIEPATGRKKSQIEEYLAYYGGAGVQHMALLTEDIVTTVQTLRDNYVEFMQTPGTYYAALEDRIGKIDENLESLRELSILIDRDDWGYLMQTFTRPLHNRPTLFFEIIQRKNARGFGAGNIKALYEALEREQLQRGNL